MDFKQLLSVFIQGDENQLQDKEMFALNDIKP